MSVVPLKDKGFGYCPECKFPFESMNVLSGQRYCPNKHEYDYAWTRQAVKQELEAHPENCCVCMACKKIPSKCKCKKTEASRNLTAGALINIHGRAPTKPLKTLLDFKSLTADWPAVKEEPVDKTHEKALEAFDKLLRTLESMTTLELQEALRLIKQVVEKPIVYSPPVIEEPEPDRFCNITIKLNNVRIQKEIVDYAQLQLMLSKITEKKDWHYGKRSTIAIYSPQYLGHPGVYMDMTQVHRNDKN